MKKFLCMFSLLLLCAYGGRINAQTESTSSATITFFRTPASLLPGHFSVSATKYVRFAKGNLQYLASQNLWRFAENQWTVIGNEAGNNVAVSRNTQSDWIDLFGWGTSGCSTCGVTNYQPWTTSATSAQYGPTISAGTSWTPSNTNFDWGVYNFNDGPNEGYNTLSKADWEYILKTRVSAATLYGAGKLFGVNGIFILPDTWDWSNVSSQVTAAAFEWTSSALDYSHNIIPSNSAGEALWEAMETKGAVFLPCTGLRNAGTAEIVTQLTALRYWTSTAASTSSSTYRAYALYLDKDINKDTWTVVSETSRAAGCAVRLVQVFGE